MSELLIIGMEMLPEGFAYDVRIKGNGDVVDRQTGVVMGKAIKVPTHGRLVDADLILSCIDEIKKDFPEAYKLISGTVERTPTVLEASTEERE